MPFNFRIPPAEGPLAARPAADSGNQGLIWIDPQGELSLSWGQQWLALNVPESAVISLTTDLASRALDSTVVHLAGAESITGQKTFTQTVLAPATPVKLPTGSAGQVLTSDASGNLTLQAPSSAKYTTTIGDGTTTSFPITHNLNASPAWSIEVVCYSTTTGVNQQIVPDIGTFTANQVTLTFATAPATNSVNVKVMA